MAQARSRKIRIEQGQSIRVSDYRSKFEHSTPVWLAIILLTMDVACIGVHLLCCHSSCAGNYFMDRIHFCHNFKTEANR